MSLTINPSTIIMPIKIKQQIWSMSNKSCPNILSVSVRPCKLNNPTYCEYLKTITFEILHYILVQFFNITRCIHMVLRYTTLKIFEY